MRLRLYSYANVDRSGKIRWTAHELGIEVEEERVEFGAQRSADYLAVNPLGQIPSAEIDGTLFWESSAICRILAERKDQLIPEPGPNRERFHVLCSVATESLEYQATAYLLSSRGILDPKLGELLEPSVRFKMAAFVDMLPSDDFLVPSQFTLADIFAGYVLRIGIQGGLIAFDDVSPYLAPLMEREAAIRSEIFASIQQA